MESFTSHWVFMADMYLRIVVGIGVVGAVAYGAVRLWRYARKPQ